jgi:hypothetical protein
MGVIFILNEMWTHDYVYISRYFAWFKHFTYRLLLVPVLAPNYKQHILSPPKVRKVYLLAKLYVKSVYLDLFGWRGREVYETLFLLGGGAQGIKVCEPLF